MQAGIFDFTLELRFEPDTDDATEILRSLSSLSRALISLDRTLLSMILPSSSIRHVLHGFETGSLKSRIRSLVTPSRSEELREKDWSRPTKAFLEEGKHFLLRWMHTHETVESPEQLAEPSSTLLDLAKKADILRVPSYARPATRKLLHDFAELSDGVASLSHTDEALLETSHITTPLPKAFFLSHANADDLSITSTHTDTAVLGIKKPDYLGSSKWEFRLGGRVIHATIRHEEWLAGFQNGEIPLGPGDAIRARILVEFRPRLDGRGDEPAFTVLEVLEVLERDKFKNLLLPGMP